MLILTSENKGYAIKEVFKISLKDIEDNRLFDEEYEYEIEYTAKQNQNQNKDEPL